MIKGIGLDIVEIDRIKKAMQNDKFIKKIFTANEIKIMNERKLKPETIAGNYAAKEALSKAIGIGIAKMGLKNVEILRELSGRPYIKTENEAKRALTAIGSSNIWLSITHDAGVAAANVIIEG